MSIYKAKIIWRSDSAEAFTKNQYTRGHEWSFDGGVTVPASSSPHAVRVPFSVEAAVDPEEALVAAASSCHMLSFLWVASQKGYVVTSYEDQAVGEMTAAAWEKQWISKITLSPRIKWTGDEPTADILAAMHDEAHHICYIANSIKSEIVVNRSE